MEKYRKEKLIGSGTFGTVWLVKSRLTRISYCMKEVDMVSLNETEKKRTLNEVTVLSQCKHKNIIRYKDAVIEHAAGKLSIIMEYADGGDLSSAIMKQRGVPFGENVIITWFIQICLALQYLHFQNILHRDLKTQNIFLTKNKTIKVGDFGIAKILRDPEDLAITAIGTPYYLSPEIIKRKPYSYKSDMWALGCVLFEMSALRLPFKASNFFDLVNVILEGRRTEFPICCSPLVKGIVQDLLRYDPNLRPSTEEVLSYPLLQPYLTNYVFQPSPREYDSPVVRIRKTSASRSLKNSQGFFGKRVVSKSTSNTVEKLTRSEKNEVIQRKTRSTSVASPAAKNRHAAERKRMKTDTKTTSPSLRALIKSPKLYNLSQEESSMNTTHLIAMKSDEMKTCTKSPSDTQSNSMRTTQDVDGGYDSAEGILYSSEDKIKMATGLNGNIREQSNNGSGINVDTAISGVHNASFGFNTDSLESTFSRSKGRYSDHFNCKHSQCNQCMIDMLWKNRIRGCIGTSGNQSEYLKLKDKLSLIFQNDLFQEVYQSLLCDWDGSEGKESRIAIKSFVKTLNYEQVQHLPLMMQLIQLDLLKKQMEEGKNSPAADIVFV